MAAGIVTVQIMDGTGTLRNTRWWSDDGTLTGNLIPLNDKDPAALAPWSYAGNAGGIVSSAASVTVRAAGAGGVRNYVTGIDLSCDTLGAATEFVITDGAAGTVLWRRKLQTAALANGIAVPFNPPLVGSANTLMAIQSLSSVTGGIYANLQGYSA